MLGGTIGQYRVTRLIGQGGMGAVYEGVHVLLGRAAAIKVLLPELTQNAELVNRFFNEAKATTQIQHRGIVEIFDFGWAADGSAYIVMELLRGESLAARIAGARLSWAHSLAIIRQLAGALAAAHAAGIVHRDLKPDNVFLISDPEVPGGERIKLLDFGIAKLAGDAGSSSLTRTGSVMGTPTYMAPEQCRGVAVDQRADLYALGCILFEMFAGRPPFVGEGTGDVLAAHIHVPAPKVGDFAPGIPPQLEGLIQNLLAKQPARRVQSAADLIGAIDAGGAPGTGTTHVRPATGTYEPLVTGAPTTLSGAAHERSSVVTGVPALKPSARAPRVIGLVVGAAAIGGIAFALSRSAGDAGARTKLVVAAPPAHEVPRPTPVAAPVPVPMQTGTASLEAPTSAMVDVALDSTPAGAEVLIDGKVVGTAPYVGTLVRGDRDVKIVFRLAGFRDRSLDVRADAAIHQSVTLDAQPKTVKAVKAVKARSGTTKPNRDQSVNPFGD